MHSTTQFAVSPRRRALVAALCAAGVLVAYGVSRPAAAQAYPHKTIRTATGVATAAAQVEGRKMKPLGVTARQRSASMARIGVATLGSTPERAGQFLRSELDKHAVLAKRGGARMDGSGRPA